MKGFVFFGAMILMMLATLGCTAQSASSSKKKKPQFYENISQYRPTYTDTLPPVGQTGVVTKDSTIQKTYVEPTKHLNVKFKKMADTLANLNLKKRELYGYRVMVYNSGTSFDLAAEKQKIYTLLPNTDIYSYYVQPKYIIKCGNYTDYMEAARDWLLLKRIYPEAIIITEKIKIKKS